MRLNDLKPADGSRPKRTRRGRGPGSGIGKTGGRGFKGQKSRSGGSIKAVSNTHLTLPTSDLV